MKKYLTLTIPAIAIILFLLRHFNILKGVYASPVFILLGTLLLSILFAYIERNVQQKEDAQERHYNNLDIMRFIFAIIVVLVHLRPFLGHSDNLDLIFNYIIGRVCVPLFFITTGFFCAKKEKCDSSYTKNYIKKMIPIYICWSILYLPLGMEALQDLNIKLTSANLPFAILIGLCYTGIYYHLWYFPALFLALIVIKVYRRFFSLRSLLILSLVLLCLGATETYFGFIPTPLQQFLSTFYFRIFYTTRNFLFFGLFYVSLGYWIGQRKKTYIPYSFIKMLFFAFLLVVEALILQPIHRLDSNILLSCVPLTYYMFITLIHIKPIITYQPKIPFRDYYKFYYFLHPAIIYLMTTFFFELDILQDHYWIQIIIVFVILQLSTMIVVKLKKTYPRLLRYL